MTEARQGDFVEVLQVYLQPEERASNLPEDTRSTPFKGWIKGFLLEAKATIGDEVTIQTLSGRKVRGVLTRVNPAYDHTFGPPHPALTRIGPSLRALLQRGEQR